MEYTRKKILNYISKKLDWELWKNIKGFNIYNLPPHLGKNLYRIEGLMPSNSKKCIELLSDTNIREVISNGSVKCDLIHKKNNSEWYEKIVFNSNRKNFIYSIEKIMVNYKNKAILTFSENPPYFESDNNYNKRDNLFTLIRFKDLTSESCKLEAILSFDEFEMVQESIVEASIEHFLSFKETL